MNEWDIITLQQVSQLSGLGETYEPYLSELANAIRKIRPKAKLYFHQTWAYEIDSVHNGFLNYNTNQKQMYNQIVSVSQKKAKSINAKIIPTGTAIQDLRENVDEFDYANGGLSLCRDGFHLSFDYGRYAAAAMWLRTLTGSDVRVTEFKDFDIKLLEKIITVINKV